MSEGIIDLNNELVLVIDDNEENLVLLERILTREGYRVEKLDTSSEALFVAQRIMPALILLDIQMPGMDGYTVCRQLKDHPSTNSIPVIFISAMESSTSKTRGFLSGAVDFIVKPIDIDETLARVRSHITIYKLQKQLEQANRDLDSRVVELTKSEEMLQERQNKLDAFINALPNLTFVYDKEGRYLEILGHNTEIAVGEISDMLGKKLDEFLSPEAAKMKMEAIHSVLQTGQNRMIEYQAKMKNGAARWFEGRFALMEKNQSGNGKVMCVTSDITTRVKLYQKVQGLAIHDPLTNCFNRRYFMDLAEKELDRAIRYQRPLSLMLIDFDHFKNVNDRFGHLAGDQALLQLVDIFKRSLRSADVMCRYGGEEFMILFPETSLEGAREVAERIRQKVECTEFLTQKGKVAVTISGGLACLESIGDKSINLDTFIEAVDNALYNAKEHGRNCIRSYKDLLRERNN